ncbi:MAG: hypothetical protein H6557_15720 [Lewinellaceae bacterium]|nr:hypothetical protein [Phaeodactylibacter sp.]MCB9038065.1 hypothetical protein [Lewinellaceae bacterium]
MKNLRLFPTRVLYASMLLWCLTVVFMLLAGTAQAQDEDQPEKDTRPVRNTFESVWLIDNQTVMVPIKGTFEMDIQHRFGTVANGYDDFWGLYASSNIRIGFNYTPIEKLQIGFGFTKENKYWDFNAKYALLQQGRSGGSPVSVTYFVNAAIDTRVKEAFPKNTFEGVERFSYFHQLMIARKVSKSLSLQASANLSHFNFQEQFLLENNPVVNEEKRNNDHLSVSILGRYKISSAMGIIVNVDLPLTDHEIADPVNVFNPEPSVSFGIEVTSSAHAFQIFLGNNYSIVPQRNNVFNQNSPKLLGDYLIGFNVTRLWNF